MGVHHTGTHFVMVFERSSSDIVPSLYERLLDTADVIKNNNPSIKYKINNIFIIICKGLLSSKKWKYLFILYLLFGICKLNTGPYVLANFAYRHGSPVESQPRAYKPWINGRDGGPGGKLVRKNITVRMAGGKFIRKWKEGNALPPFPMSLFLVLWIHVCVFVGLF